MSCVNKRKVVSSHSRKKGGDKSFAFVLNDRGAHLSIAVLKKVRYALCPMPYALCPVVPHLSEKGYMSL